MSNSPNMGLPISVVGITTGLQWEQNLNFSLTLIDAHDHSPGKGVPIAASSLNINTDLTINNNNLTLVRSIRFQPQSAALSGASDLGCLYEAGVNLYYNDGNGNQIQITSGGAVNATSSGISSGTATASFVSSVLVVNAAASTPANIQVASVLLGNNVANSKYLTLSPPNSMAANYGLTLPPLPPGTKIMTLDSSGNITAPYTVDNSTIVISSNVIQVPTSGITATQLASSSVTTAKIASQNVTVDKLAPAPFVATPATLGQVLLEAANLSPNFYSSPQLVATGDLTTSGRPIKISLQSDGSGALSAILVSLTGGANTTGTIYVQIDGGALYPYTVGTVGPTSMTLYTPSSAVNWLIPVTAGTHTINLFAQSTVATSTIGIQNTQMIAYEI